MSEKSAVLSNREYDKLVKEVRSRAFKACDDVVQEFVKCSHNRVLSVAWACREQNTKLYNCLLEQCVATNGSMSDKVVEAAEKEFLAKRNEQHAGRA
ncbi:hypothetical protein MCUN1_001532 [Malassezia cuniculi]|uniref:COX assembly mitochondrial protein n=1 Tax=Malassezia cuniculi TaxID=948313 RepID=A0AAF0EUQ1_9BASI|nr:hypothetical protein MCUN1_001532 [Malassezia cuniculi]